jgi:hypothetical protein
MASYNRLIKDESDVADTVDAFVSAHGSGITIGGLMQTYPTVLQNASAIYLALQLLEEEGIVRVEKWRGHDDPLDNWKAFPTFGK